MKQTEHKLNHFETPTSPHTVSGPLDSSTAIRADFKTSYTATIPSPPNAHPKSIRLFNTSLTLFKAIGEDAKMARNSLQTFNTPATDKNVQYFAWDFVMRTVVGSDPSYITGSNTIAEY